MLFVAQTAKVLTAKIIENAINLAVLTRPRRSSKVTGTDTFTSCFTAKTSLTVLQALPVRARN